MIDIKNNLNDRLALERFLVYWDNSEAPNNYNELVEKTFDHNENVLSNVSEHVGKVDKNEFLEYVTNKDNYDEIRKYLDDLKFEKEQADTVFDYMTKDYHALNEDGFTVDETRGRAVLLYCGGDADDADYDDVTLTLEIEKNYEDGEKTYNFNAIIEDYEMNKWNYEKITDIFKDRENIKKELDKMKNDCIEEKKCYIKEGKLDDNLQSLTIKGYNKFDDRQKEQEFMKGLNIVAGLPGFCGSEDTISTKLYVKNDGVLEMYLWRKNKNTKDTEFFKLDKNFNKKSMDLFLEQYDKKYGKKEKKAEKKSTVKGRK